MKFATIAAVLATVTTAACVPTPGGGFPFPNGDGNGPNNGNGGAPTCSNQSYKPHCCDGQQDNILLGIVIGLGCSIFSKTCNQEVTCCAQTGLINICDVSLIDL